MSKMEGNQSAARLGLLGGIWCWLLLWGALTPAVAQQLQFRHITIEDGLSQSTVYSIVQDRRGFIWLGTQDGLNRWDGYSTVVYQPDPYDISSLSNREVLCLLEDHDGVLWAGTRGGGLNRFDRRHERFARYLSLPDVATSLSNNEVMVLLEDHQQVLWVGTNGGGLNRYDRTTETFTRLPTDPAHGGLSDNRVRCLLEDRHRYLWVGTNGGGLNRLDGTRQEITTYRHDPDRQSSLSDDRVHALFEDQAGTIWVGTDGGLDRLIELTPEGAAFEHNTADPNDPSGLCDNRITSIFEDSSQNLWVGTRGGLSRLDRATGSFVNSREVQGDPSSLTDNGICTITEDRAGLLWIGTWNGANLYDGSSERFRHYQHIANDPTSLSHNRVFSICGDHTGDLWIATDGGGVNRMDPATGTFTHLRHDPARPSSICSDSVFFLLEDRDHYLWIGTNGCGLDRLDPDRKAITNFHHEPDDATSLSDDDIFCMLEGRRHPDRLWVGTRDGGLNLLDRSSGSFHRFRHDPLDATSISHDTIFSVFEDRHGVLWVGTWGGGLNRMAPTATPENASFSTFRHNPLDPASISDNSILDIHEDRSGVLWVCTTSGLNRLDRSTGRFTHLFEEDGLSADCIYGMLEDENGVLWISTVKGLTSLDPATMRWKTYDSSDGLQSNEFSSWSFYRAADGELFFGGINGMNAFYPESIHDNPVPPQVVITSLQLYNRTVPIGADQDGRTLLESSIIETRHVELSHRDDVVSFEIAALHYFAPEKNRYAYRMEPLEQEWNMVGSRRFATYTNLPAGEYTFRVKAANKDGIWNENGVTLGITITPAFYQTLWFRGTAAATLLLVLLSLYRIRVHRVELRNQRLEQAVRERTAKLQRALAEVKTLTGMLPICASCKRIRDDEGYWQQVEVYLKQHSSADFSHAICPECVRSLYPDIYHEVCEGGGLEGGEERPGSAGVR